MAIITVDTNLDVADAGDGVTSLREAITFANANVGTTIEFSNTIANQTITLSKELPLLLGNNTAIDGGANHITISGADIYRVFFIGDAGQIADGPGALGDGITTVSIANLTITHAMASGGNGVNGSGGGAGLGGAIFVSSTGALTLSNVDLSANAARGGNGGNFHFASLGGGGGMGGNGGGFLGNAGGGGGFGIGADGATGTFGSANGGTGAFTGGGSGGNGASGGLGGSFGGGGGYSDGSVGGQGGGGVGGANGTLNSASPFGIAHGGNGGFGGGGGAGTATGSFPSDDAIAGSGGFGGGGGSASTVDGVGGSGGFGGGSGTGGGFVGEAGMFGGGAADDYGGGGGAALGGAVFVMEGGSLTYAGALTIANSTVTAGANGTGSVAPLIPVPAEAHGAGMFLHGSGTIAFTLAAGETQTVSDAIADQQGSGGGSYNLVKSGDGTLVLGGNNAYVGTTTVNDGVLRVNGSIVSATTVNSGGTLGGNGTVSAVTVNSGGTLAPGNSAGTLNTGNLLLAAGAAFAAELGGTGFGQFDVVNVTGTVNLTGATLSGQLIAGFDLKSATNLVLRIIDNDGTDAVVGTFAGLAEGALLTIGTRNFTISYAAGTGNDVVLTTANNQPTTAASVGAAAATEQIAAAIDNALTVADVNDTALASATVSITGNFHSGQDVLQFTDQNGISGGYDAAAGVLVLAGVSSVANYQAALQSITYINTSDAPDTANRTVSFVVSDGVVSSTASTKTLTVTALNDVPVVTTTGGATAAFEQFAAAIDGALTLVDPDNPSLASATVSITGNFHAGQDVLVFSNQNGISGSYNATNGVLTLTGAASVANYQAALRSVAYLNTVDTPDTGNRTVSFVVNDGGVDSVAATKTVSVTAIDDASLFNLTVPVAENSTVVTTIGGIDPDGGLTYSIVAGADQAKFQIGSSTGVLSFIAAPDFENPTDANHDNSYIVQVRAFDGATGSDLTLTVNVTDVAAPAIVGDGGANTLIGTSENDTIQGLGGNDTLDGGAGADTMVGGLGNDVFYVDNNFDVITETAGQGTDTVYSTQSFQLGGNVEFLFLQGVANINGFGDAVTNYIEGNSGDNGLNGGAGTDALVGRAGNDLYFVDNAGDVVTEAAGEGNDTVFSTVTYTLSAEVESLVLQGSANINGTGNALANLIQGNSGNNVLDGGTGADTMIGGVGNDNYVVDLGFDAITESSGEGNDTVFTAVTYVLPGNVENLVMQGAGGTAGYGNTLANVITGTTGADVIDGLSGADTMFGYAGNDVFNVDNNFEVINEAVGEGTDTVYSTVSFQLGGNVEFLFLQGSGNINGFGDAATNYIEGNSGDNGINGGGGTDALYGMGGNDLFIFAAGQANGDILYDFAGNGGSAGDQIQFTGFGTIGGGATFTNVGGNQWQIHSGIDAHNEVITLNNGASVHASDFFFT